MKKIKISDRDARLLFILLSLIVIAISYFFFYQKNMAKAEQINTSNKELQTRLNEMTEMEGQKAIKEKETEEFILKKDRLLECFPGGMTAEDCIVIVDAIEKYADMKINSASFSLNQVFYPETAQIQDTQTEVTDSTAEIQATDTPTTDSLTNDLIGYKSTITISFSTTYAGLKQVCEYIHDYDTRMTIADLGTTYDTSTGNLSGSMTINVYSISGFGKEYVAPEFSGINFGKDNIFGTFENKGKK